MIRTEPVAGEQLTYELIDPDEQLASAEFGFVEHFLRSTRRLQQGWHYITDLVWIYRKVQRWPRGTRILDAGGGTGALQFLLSELGFDVTNIDMVFPAEPLPILFDRYRLSRKQLRGLTQTEYARHVRSLRRRANTLALWPLYRGLRGVAYRMRHDRWRIRAGCQSGSIGRIEWVAGDLCDLNELPAASFDAVVSLSALEHIPLGQLGHAWSEIKRILKPGAPYAVTISASASPDTWLHEPSQGWCFSLSDLTTRFGAEPVRHQDSAAVLERYRRCSYLKERLSRFYRRSGNNGMPWGIWAPQYIPVGLSR